MRILILGGDGYLGWPQAMYLSRRSHEVFLVDNFARRHFDLEVGSNSVVPIQTLHQRVRQWNKNEWGKPLQFRVGSTSDYSFLAEIFRAFQPEAVVHFAEQKSAPFSMLNREHAQSTFQGNHEGTLNVLYAIREFAPSCHLIKLGTMGEYGTPNIEIEEGFLEVTHQGRKDTFLYPKNPGSFYHLSKVHGSYTVKKCCDWWGVRATELNQGIVYGAETEEAKLSGLPTRFDYDQIYGTALNRFCIQAALGHPLTVHGEGGQKRSFLNIKDTLRCVELAILNPPEAGKFRVFNQFTELFTILELAQKVQATALKLKMKCEISYLPNPRVESEGHYYSAKNSCLKELGLKPTLLQEDLLTSLIELASRHIEQIDPELVKPSVQWRTTASSLPT